ncbi:hypothetical protein ADL07_26525 [Streptomyces sp. NRRL F-4707]|nr:hypothetical protein ADL07_26525 [Streptomyces sp. NRRL F-4707]
MLRAMSRVRRFACSRAERFARAVDSIVRTPDIERTVWARDCRCLASRTATPRMRVRQLLPSRSRYFVVAISWTTGSRRPRHSTVRRATAMGVVPCSARSV